MAKLYDLTDNYRNLLELFENSEVPVEIIQAALDGVKEEIDMKGENIAKLIKCLEVDEVGFGEEITRLQNRKRVIGNKIDSLKAYLDSAMKATGTEKIKGKVFTISLQNNPPSVDVIDAAEIPETYYIPQDPKLDKKTLLDALKHGETIPGAALKQTKGLRIR